MRARQSDYARDTIDAYFLVLIAPRDGIQFLSFLSEKVSPDFLPGNGLDLPRLYFLPPSFRFGGPCRFDVCVWLPGFKTLNEQTYKRGSLRI